MEVVAIVGLGYVGLPLAVAFGKLMPTVGYDLSSQKIQSYGRGVDPGGTVSGEDLRTARHLTFTDNAARRINDHMGKFIAEQTVKQLIQTGNPIKGAKVNVLGITFKENVPDLRNSKAWDLIVELRSYGVEVYVHDPVADAEDAKQTYGIELTAWDSLPQADALVVAVVHQVLITKPMTKYAEKLKPGGCFIDVKAQFNCAQLEAAGLKAWRL